MKYKETEIKTAFISSKKVWQFTQNKWIRFCLKLDRMHHISEKDFKQLTCRLFIKEYNEA